MSRSSADPHGKRQTSGQPRPENEAIYRGICQSVTAEKTVSNSTGNVQIRFRHYNPHRVIFRGLFFRGEIALGTDKAYLATQRATERSNIGDLKAS